MSAAKASLAMAIHFHQPTGNFDHVIKRACDKCYVPFLELLKKYPDVKMSLHFTGCLLEWVEKKRPEIIEMIRGMAERSQIEVISGGFYEPILTVIPERDRYRQIEMLNNYAEKKLSFKPKGAWIAERVWEPSLPGLFEDSGIKYVVLDDTHFIYSGISKDDTYGYYITEDNGKIVAAFPSDKMLRYYIPYKMPGECIDYIRGIAEKKKDSILVYGDDGEKFGEWPGTYKWVFQEKWLEQFFDALSQNADWLTTVKLSDYLKNNAPIGKVYLGTGSYEEMFKWSLPAGAGEYFEDVMNDVKSMDKADWYGPFMRGGFWRNFMAKYPESNNMNKKMLYVSKRIEGLKKNKVNKKDLASAEKELYRGQCNCAYWHGVFGGLYLFHLRQAVYGHLIRSESITDEILHGSKDFCEKEVLDIDADGNNEIILRNKNISLYIDPSEGGIIKELDSKSACSNLINSLARRKEAYHRKIKEKADQTENSDDQVKTIHDGIQKVNPGIKDHLVYDKHDRYSLVDHFLPRDISIEDIKNSGYDEIGDFVGGTYDFKVEELQKGIFVTMKRDGTVDNVSVSLTKEIFLPKKGAGLDIAYSIVNTGGDKIDLIFSPEFNVTMPEGDSDRYRIKTGGDKKDKGLGCDLKIPSARGFTISDKKKELSFELELSEACDIFHFPLKTVSQSEKAYELNYQSSVVMPLVGLSLDPKEKKQFKIKVMIID